MQMVASRNHALTQSLSYQITSCRFRALVAGAKSGRARRVDEASRGSRSPAILSFSASSLAYHADAVNARLLRQSFTEVCRRAAIRARYHYALPEICLSAMFSEAFYNAVTGDTASLISVRFREVEI